MTVGGGTAAATTPGKNGLILFHADTGSGAQLYTIKPNGSHLRQLTHVAGEALNGDWSPDGRRIAFELATETHAGIAIMHADGSGIHDLTPPASRASRPSPPTATTWSIAATAPAAKGSSSSVTTAPAVGA